MLDFNKYDDVTQVYNYNGFIDKLGNFYKVSPKKTQAFKDNHNEWAQQFIKDKLNIKDFNFNPTVSALFTLTSLNGPAEILIHCFGYVYYSHDPYYYKPIINVPNPKISNHKVTQEQLDTLYLLMRLNNENTDIPIFYDEDEYTNCDINEGDYKHL